MGCYSYSVSSKVREEIMEIYSLIATMHVEITEIFFCTFVTKIS